MARVRSESRCRIGIDWYDNEAEADAAAIAARQQAAIARQVGYDFGYMSIGRDRVFDRKDEDGNTVEFAVVTP